MDEEWKDVIGFEGRYQVSNLGNIRSCDKYARVCGGGFRFVKGKSLIPRKCTNGYLEYTFTNGRSIKKTYLLHRLVATYFIPNPEHLPEVNHIDEDITNNCVSNLEWCTSKYNANYGNRNKKMMQTKEKKGQLVPVDQFAKDGRFVRHWNKMSEAAAHVGVDVSSIIRVCRGKQRTSMGYIWKYGDGYKKPSYQPE